MIDGLSPHGRSHSAGLEVLRLRRDHAIILGDEKPRGPIFPQGTGSLLLNAFHIDRTLCGCQQRLTSSVASWAKAFLNPSVGIQM
jgi:hypothetical protein